MPPPLPLTTALLCCLAGVALPSPVVLPKPPRYPVPPRPQVTEVRSQVTEPPRYPSPQVTQVTQVRLQVTEPPRGGADHVRGATELSGVVTESLEVKAPGVGASMVTVLSEPSEAQSDPVQLAKEAVQVTAEPSNAPADPVQVTSDSPPVSSNSVQVSNPDLHEVDPTLAQSRSESAEMETPERQYSSSSLPAESGALQTGDETAQIVTERPQVHPAELESGPQGRPASTEMPLHAEISENPHLPARIASSHPAVQTAPPLVLTASPTVEAVSLRGRGEPTVAAAEQPNLGNEPSEGEDDMSGAEAQLHRNKSEVSKVESEPAERHAGMSANRVQTEQPQVDAELPKVEQNVSRGISPSTGVPSLVAVGTPVSRRTSPRPHPPSLHPVDPPQAACSLPRDRGACTNFSRRWHFDDEQGDCASFWFGGCGGNGNRFPTAAACRSVCVAASGVAACLQPAVRGPCLGAELRWAFDAAAGACATFVYGGCYGTGNRFATRGQCEERCLPESARADRRCLARPAATAQCGGERVRYSFVPETQSCVPFLFGGCGGNGNNFATYEQCREVCLVSVEGESEGSGLGADGDRTDNVTRVKMDGEQTASAVDICLLPRSVGSCFSYAPMFYHDTRTGRCHQFSYRGCGGNANRFHTRRECEDRCVGRPVPAAADSAPNITRLNISTSTASSTATEASVASPELATVAPVRRTASPPSGPPHSVTSSPRSVPSSPRSVPSSPAPRRRLPSSASRRSRRRHRRPVRRACGLPLRRGRCRGYLPRFYYNAALGSCYAFIYGGCGGNPNRFRTKAACQELCKGFTRES